MNIYFLFFPGSLRSQRAHIEAMELDWGNPMVANLFLAFLLSLGAGIVIALFWQISQREICWEVLQGKLCFLVEGTHACCCVFLLLFSLKKKQCTSYLDPIGIKWPAEAMLGVVNLLNQYHSHLHWTYLLCERNKAMSFKLLLIKGA